MTPLPTVPRAPGNICLAMKLDNTGRPVLTASGDIIHCGNTVAAEQNSIFCTRNCRRKFEAILHHIDPIYLMNMSYEQFARHALEYVRKFNGDYAQRSAATSYIQLIATCVNEAALRTYDQIVLQEQQVRAAADLMRRNQLARFDHMIRNATAQHITGFLPTMLQIEAPQAMANRLESGPVIEELLDEPMEDDLPDYVEDPNPQDLPYQDRFTN